MTSLRMSDIPIPSLADSVLAALELVGRSTLPEVNIHRFKRPLVIGSGNALPTGRILFAEVDATFANQDSYEQVLKHAQVDGVVLISASGGKSSIAIAQKVKAHSLPLVLLTNTPNSAAAQYADDVLLFPKNPEPYTYNVSTYLSMILAVHQEDVYRISSFLDQVTAGCVPDTSTYDALFFVVPAQFEAIADMIRNKCDELFGPNLSVRAYTYEETLHGKTLVPSEKELFIHIGETQEPFGMASNRVHVSLMDGAGYGAALATTYFLIGKIQEQHPAWFAENLEAYTRFVAEQFGQDIQPIVE